MSSYWRDDARCNPSNAALFDPLSTADRIRGRRDMQRISHAITICRSCPVAALCLTEALACRDSGVRGGRLLEDGETDTRMPAELVA